MQSYKATGAVARGLGERADREHEIAQIREKELRQEIIVARTWEHECHESNEVTQQIRV